MYRFLFLCLLFLSAQSANAATETIRFYSSPGFNGITSDGRTFEDRFQSWEQTVNNLSSRAAGVDDNHILDISNILGDGFGPGYFANNRLHFSFDTSVIPEDANIVSSALYLHGSDPDQSSGSEKSVYAVESMRTSPSSLSVSDYSKVGNVSFGLTDDNWNTTGYNVINFNQSGINHISKTSITSFALRGWYDFNHVAPDNANELYIHMMMSEVSGTDMDPYLEVTYEVPEVVESKDMYDLLRELIETVEGYSFSGEIEGSYFANLKKVEGFFNSVKYTPAENQIRAFVKKIEQDFKAGKITQAQYDDLLVRANAVLEAIPDDAFGTVPLITQVVSPYPSLEETTSWANEVYADGRANKVGDCGRTIAQCGCAVSSLGMVGKYHGIDTGFDGTEVNPLNMNNWLLNGGKKIGYDRAGNIQWSWGLAYLGEEKNEKYMSHLRIENASTNVMSNIKSFIEDEGPALGFNKPRGHWTVLTGNIEGGGFSVRDPFWYNTKTTNDDAAPNVKDYNDVVTKAALFAYQPTLKPIQELLEHSLNSPAQLLLINEKGKRVGYDAETSTYVNEIPNASYDPEFAILNQVNPSANPHYTKHLMVVEPEGDVFELQVIGTGDGEYHLTNSVSDGKGALGGETVAGETEVGKVESYTIVTNMESDALPLYLKDILVLIPANEQKKFVQAFKVIFAQTEKDHVAVTKTLVENLIRYTETKYATTSWGKGVIVGLRALEV